MITGGDEVCILPPPTLSEKGVGIPTLSISLIFFSERAARAGGGREGALQDFFFFFFFFSLFSRPRAGLATV